VGLQHLDHFAQHGRALAVAHGAQGRTPGVAREVKTLGEIQAGVVDPDQGRAQNGIEQGAPRALAALPATGQKVGQQGGVGDMAHGRDAVVCANAVVTAVE
jgi:hypothetical protein